MALDDTVESDQPVTELSSRPSNIQMGFRGFEQEAAEDHASTLGELFHEVGKLIDISALDGVTIGFDYDEALASLDRGYETVHTLSKTTEFGLGVAMTPAVLRDGVLKSHIVINAAIVLMLSHDDQQDVKLAVHTIAHECAHVEVTAAFEKCFPGELLIKRFDTIIEFWRWDVIRACWDEYAACRIASDIGHDPLSDYEETFVLAHSKTDEKILSLIRDFDGGDADPLVGPVFGAYGTMMKFACYMMGSMAASGKTLENCKAANDAMQGHWFADYFERLKNACESLFDNFGNWPDKSEFELIGDIVEDIVASRAMKLWHHPDGSYSIYIYPAVLTKARSLRS
jgi:hypothetical protein